MSITAGAPSPEGLAAHDGKSATIDTPQNGKLLLPPGRAGGPPLLESLRRESRAWASSVDDWKSETEEPRNDPVPGPEEMAREKTDAQLLEAGWVVQDRRRSMIRTGGLRGTQSGQRRARASNGRRRSSMRERWPAVRVSGCLGLLAAVMMLGANESWSAPQAARIGPRAVFSPKRDLETKVIEEMQSCPVAVDAGAPKIECVISILRQAGATPEALAFTVMLGGEGYLESFRQMGKVDLATVAYPLRANENEGFMLVNGSPPTIQVEDFVHLKHIDIRKDPLYPAIARKFPRVEPWGHADFKAVQALPGGGQRFIFSFVLLNGCHACEVAGYAQVAFDFSAAGGFLGTKLLRLTEKG